ncbi:MAG: IclR family transcriptional regulator [Anaerolineaceae bacterium]|jgi:DNA-binding IclR family transcriptional regulator|nr:IclR family transcriptional regulator [Anaerolineaceae bacterium]
MMQTLERAVSILNCFTLAQPELGVREVARMVDLSVSTTGRLMSSLKDVGLLSQNPNSREYALGAGVMAWAGVYTATLDVRNAAMPAVNQIHRETQETISLYILQGAERVCVERRESPHTVRLVTRIGRRLPLHAGSAGKVFLAFLPPERTREILDASEFKPFTPNTIVDRNLLEAELEVVRRQGYAVSTGEWQREASGIAAPIFDSSGEIIAALTISGPSQRFNDAKMREYAGVITSAANEVSRNMGYRG